MIAGQGSGAAGKRAVMTTERGTPDEDARWAEAEQLLREPESAEVRGWARRLRTRTVWMAAAAAFLVLFLVGAAAGWMVAGREAAASPAPAEAATPV